jgi:hypothetical protein
MSSRSRKIEKAVTTSRLRNRLSRWIGRLGQTAILLVPVASFAQSPSSRSNELIYWSKSEFTIPFHVEASGRQPAEVQLEASVDSGKTWEVQSRDNPGSRQFRFVSYNDGEYWFRIKTIDVSGRSFESGGVPLKVVVDTKSPDLSLSVSINERGDMVAAFVVRDANAVENGLRLEYQTEQSQSWTSIPFTIGPEGISELSGQGSWEIPVGSRQMVVRLVARDAAGNESEVTRLPQVPKTAFGQGNMQLASGSPTNRFQSTYPEVKTAPQSLPSVTTKSQSPNNLPSPLLMGQSSTLSNLPSPILMGEGSGVRVSGKEPKQSVAPSAIPTSNTTVAPMPTPATRPPASSAPYSIRSMDDEKKPPGSSDEILKLDGSSETSRTDKTIEGYTPVALEKLGGIETVATPTEKPFYSSSKAFSLDYEVDSPASSPISAVELWGTVDAGKTWERWGTDPDGVSPFEIKVESEGLFGFRMVVIGTNGLAGNRPRNGDNADAWIHVDTTMPMARIHSALYGKGTEAGSLVIEYSAQDEFFGERPIAFLYSELPTGPWTTLSNGVRNNGRFVWPADPNLPRRIYLRIEAHDEAGNVASHTMDLPIDVEGLAPRGRIQGFRPMSK